MIILGILIIILLLCIIKHIVYTNKEHLEVEKKNLLLNNNFKYSNIIAKMPKKLLYDLDNIEESHLICPLKYRCNEYSNYISESDHNYPWNMHFKYIDTKSINNKNNKTTFTINKNKCYIYSYNKNIDNFNINNYYEIKITAKSDNSNIKIKPYLSNNFTDENNKIIYDKNIKLSKITNKEIIWVYYLKDSRYNSLNWYIENGSGSQITLYNQGIYKIKNIDKYLEDNKEIINTDLVKCSINKYKIKSNDDIIKEIKNYIEIIYVNKNKNPDNFVKYSDLLNHKMKEIKNEIQLKHFLKIILTNNKCNSIIKPVIAYNIYLYNKINPRNKIKDDKEYLEKNYINYIEWGKNFLDDKESNSIELLIIDIISKIEYNLFSSSDYENNEQIFYDLYKKYENSINDKKDLENIISTIFKFLTKENLKVKNTEYMTESKIFTNWNNLIESINPDNKKIKLQFIHSKDDLSFFVYMIDDFLKSLVYIILKIIHRIMDKKLELNIKMLKLINNNIINLLKDNISEDQITNIITKLEDSLSQDNISEDQLENIINKLEDKISEDELMNIINKN